MEEKKRKALMRIIRRIFNSGTIIGSSYMVLYSSSFRLFELAKQIASAEDDETLRVALLDLDNFNK